MIRLIIKELAPDPDGKTHIAWKTFDVELPEVEEYLSREVGMYGSGSHQIVGAECMAAERAGKEGS